MHRKQHLHVSSAYNRDQLFCDVINEILRAEEKFPGWPDDFIHGAAIVGEEAGELLQATYKHTYENGALAAIRKEAIQTAAMSLRLIMDLDKRREEP